MTTTACRFLIVNADDFGLSAGVNAGIIRAHEHGIVTAASLMVRKPGAPEAARYARDDARVGVGLHIDLGEWAYFDGDWRQVDRVLDDTTDPAAVEREVRAQLTAFHDLVGRPPTHLDSHQHVHQHEPLRTIVLRLAAELGVPARALTPGIRYDGSFYGQDGRGRPFPAGISPENLIRLIHALPPGTTELGCHPGFVSDFSGTYCGEREIEVQTLCAPEARQALRAAGISLTTHGFVART